MSMYNQGRHQLGRRERCGVLYALDPDPGNRGMTPSRFQSAASFVVEAHHHQRVAARILSTNGQPSPAPNTFDVTESPPENDAGGRVQRDRCANHTMNG